MDFKLLFKEITGNNPYPWQERLYEKICNGETPKILDIPTGLGKTSIIAIWLIALYHSITKSTNYKVPTRLVYIVDRRVIVDQASDEATRIIGYNSDNNCVENHFITILKKHDAEIPDVIRHLTISKLRGGGMLADSREWLSHPDCPAIIIGTVDMIGSRLFFSGYGVSNKIKAFYAGLLGQDSLIVLDETHLSPALKLSLEGMESISHNNINEKLCPSNICFMSATQRGKQNKKDVFGLDELDFTNDQIKKRYDSEKNLSLVNVPSSDLVESIIKQTFEMKNRTLIYVQKPNDAKKIADHLIKSDYNVVILTGTLRGFERDKLVNNITYKAFLSKDLNKNNEKNFLVSTSAGEVGADFDADDMICDLTAMDSMIQRFGRVNRSGGKKSKIVVVYSEEIIKKHNALSEQMSETKTILEKLIGTNTACNVSPHSLATANDERWKKAFSPEPNTQHITQDIIDMWSLTSIHDKYTSRPSVHYWLRGEPQHTIETYVAWREDTKYLTGLEPDEIQEILDIYRILPHETARDTYSNVKKILKKIEDNNGNEKIIINKPNGKCESMNLAEVKDADLYFSTILLPCQLGGLDKDGSLGMSGTYVKDVADDTAYKKRARLHIRYDEKEQDATILEIIGDKKQSIDKKLSEWIKENPNMRLLHTISNTEDEDEYEKSTVEIHYYVEITDQQQSKSLKEQTLDDHLIETENVAKDITKNMPWMKNELKDAIRLAARYHDKGKARKHWQDCMHINPNKTLAKTAHQKKPLPMGGFRHELASVADSASNPDISKHPEKDLILHLIEAHHGWARPCFKSNAFIWVDNQTSIDTIRRYAILHKRFGAWGLAWLESILRGADWQASEFSGSAKNE